ncbi:MAG: 4'-phosphopantetheinyl transferase superfamily protein [Acholeplasmatales bacterium]|nr:4'-phosphopantetheinyl transferase superfamily protein [Acholeplasmatales bacterium]
MENKYNILNEDIFVYDVRNDNYETLKKYFSRFLTINEINEIESYKLEQDKICRILSYSIPKIKLAKELNINPCDIVIIRDKNKRPLYKDYNYYYSVSHTKNYLAFVLSKENVGLDIEERVLRDFKAISYVSSEEEYNECKEPDDYYTLWTFKEAYAKLKGTGITKELNNILTYKYKNKQTIYINHLVITLVKE